MYALCPFFMGVGGVDESLPFRNAVQQGYCLLLWRPSKGTRLSKSACMRTCTRCQQMDKLVCLLRRRESCFFFYSFPREAVTRCPLSPLHLLQLAPLPSSPPPGHTSSIVSSRLLLGGALPLSSYFFSIPLERPSRSSCPAYSCCISHHVLSHVVASEPGRFSS